MKICVACGMPMKKTSDFAMGDTNKDYCIYCSRPDGTMQSYEEKLDSLANFIVKTQGLAIETAKNTAQTMMLKLPAWENHTR